MTIGNKNTITNFRLVKKPEYIPPIPPIPPTPPTETFYISLEDGSGFIELQNTTDLLLQEAAP
jgi:hypothetical protein